MGENGRTVGAVRDARDASTVLRDCRVFFFASTVEPALVTY